jgi:hypothetical protein
VRWRALGQRLLWRGAIWVRDGADRLLIRLRAGDASSNEDPNRKALPAGPNGAEDGDRDRPASVPPGGDGVLEHWRARVHTAPPRHWLERVEAARRRFKTVWIEAVARPTLPSSLPPADDSSSRELPGPPPRSYDSTEDSSSPELLPHRPPSYERAEDPSALELPRDRPRSYDGLVFEPAPGRPRGAREEEPPALPPRRSVAAARPSLPGPAGSRTIDEAPRQGPASIPSAPAVRDVDPRPREERHSAPPLEADDELGTRPRRPSWPPVEPFSWSTARRGDGVRWPDNRQYERDDNTSAARPAPADRALRRDRPTTSIGAADLVWTDAAAPVRERVDPSPIEFSKPVRSGAGAWDGQSFPESNRAWPSFLPRDPWQRSTAPGPGLDGAATARGASEETFFCTNEPADRWPALPDAPSAAEEDWPAMKNRLERLDRLDREQRGW